MTFVLLYGPPAVGKLTVATELAVLTGFKVFHNHLSLDLAETLFARGTPAFEKTVYGVRRLVLEEAARSGTDLIFTYAYAYGSDDPELAWMIAAVEQYSARVALVFLSCAPATLRERVVNPSRRAYGKISEVAVLDGLLNTYDLFSPYPARPSLQLDTTGTLPHETAEAIAAHLASTS